MHVRYLASLDGPRLQSPKNDDGGFTLVVFPLRRLGIEQWCDNCHLFPMMYDLATWK